jgi:hypothetical protein
MATMLPKRWGWILLGVGAGWAVNLKITAPVYFVPLVVLYWQRRGFSGVWKAGVLGGGLAALPFAATAQISLGNYVAWLGALWDQGTEVRRMAVPPGGHVALIGVPVACAVGVLAWSRPERFWELARRYRWFGVSAGMTFLAVLRIAVQPGAGPAHLLPLYPVLGVVLVKSLAELGGGERVVLRAKEMVLKGVGVVMTLALGALAVRSTWVNVIEECNWKEGSAMVAEVRGLTEKYAGRGLEMGVGSSRERYATARYQAELVVRGNPYLLDVTAMMDMQKAGRGIPQETLAMMARGACEYWLVPRGEEPFALRNYYEPEGMIFDEKFRQVFREHYRIVDRSAHFEVWGYDEATRGPT